MTAHWQYTPNDKAKLRSVRISDRDWIELQQLAADLVPDSEMPADARKDAGKVTQLIRMIARRQIKIQPASPQEP